jgi:hypothetical protein
VGSLNAPIPLLTASTPVIAVQPLANARSRIQSVTASLGGGSGGGGRTGTGAPPAAIVRTTPSARSATKLPTKR